MPLSFDSNLFAVAINNESFTGERIRETGEAVIAIPSIGSESFIMGCGSTSGRDTNKVERFAIERKAIENTDIRIPIHSTAAIIGKLVRFEEIGNHHLYIMEVKVSYGDEAETPLFAWKGYSEAALVEKK